MDFMNPDRWIDYQRAFDVRYDFGRSVGLADALELCEIEPDIFMTDLMMQSIQQRLLKN